MNYSSPATKKIYQENPAYSKPTTHTPKGWTDTVLGYLNEARQWAICVLRNRQVMKRPYTWAVHINFNEELPPATVARYWNQTKRKLNDRGIVCLCVCEPNSLNKVHFHIIVKNEIDKAGLAKAIEQSMPPRTAVKWRKRIEPIKKEWRLCHYIFKAKISGRNKRGVVVDDLYRNKRLLFLPKLPFKKVSTVGKFWEKGLSKGKVWNEIKAIEKKIGEGLDDDRVRKVVRHIRQLLGDDVPTRRIERSFGFFADEKNIKEWLGTINDDGDY